MHTYNIFTGKSFLKVIVSRNVKNCTIYNHYRAEKIVDVKPHPTKFGHHPIEQYSGVSQKLNFLFETGAIITEYRYYINISLYQNKNPWFPHNYH